MDEFTVIAEPTRRLILDRLRTRAFDVGGLVGELGISQSLASKHLRVLREAGLVDVAVAGKRRVYRLSERPLPGVVEWIAPYAELWSTSFDRLAETLDAEFSGEEPR